MDLVTSDFINRGSQSPLCFNYYYENTGGNSNPIYTQRTSLITTTSNYTERPTFVDIDGDGDMDCFVGLKSGYYGTEDILAYYENTGSATNPTFTLQSAANNPLDSINTHVITRSGGASFVDIDGDGDMDCLFHSIYTYFLGSGAGVPAEVYYYENTGTVTVPSFRKRNGTLNPFSMISGGSGYQSRFVAHDEDNDGDLDILVRGGGSSPIIYFENTGSATLPNLVQRTGTSNPYANTGVGTNRREIQSIVDIDQDGDMDFFRTDNPGGGFTAYFYFENQTTTSIFTLEQSKLELTIFPNPTTGIINLEKPLIGSLEVFNTLGQVVQTQQLEEEQQLDLNHLGNGTYIVKIQREEGVLQEKVVLQR